MVTLRQLEALVWIVRLRTFERAARHLNTTQSAISKRVQELEAATSLAVFDRRQRGVRLTLQGEKLLVLAEEMLELRDRVGALREDASFPRRNLNIGVTELSALTWLPTLVTTFRSRYAPMAVRPEIGKSRSLVDALQEGRLDIVVVPKMAVAADVRTVELRQVTNAWLAKAGLVTMRGALSPRQLASHPILMQERASVYSGTLAAWLKEEGVVPEEVMTCNSLTALIGLTAAGLGVSFLPQRCFQHLIEDGTLEEIETVPPAPSVSYVAMFREEAASAFTSEIIGLLREVCTFNQMPPDHQSNFGMTEAET
ncbi:MAG: LysR family transcriptional regulator [Mesorhizobium amorphae]|nr:MAG: LysR family transcriptional regulator [Mesorhizobium amorphae]